MIIEIKGKRYSNPDFNVQNGLAVFRIHSEKSFSEIAEDFVLENGDSIIQYNDSEEQIGEFYVEGMASIRLPGEDGSEVVTIKYKVSQLGKEAQEALNDDLEMATISILELSGIVSQAKRNFNDTATRLEGRFSDHEEQLTSLTNAQNTINAAMNRWETMYNTLADRVARLENKLGE